MPSRDCRFVAIDLWSLACDRSLALSNSFDLTLVLDRSLAIARSLSRSLDRSLAIATRSRSISLSLSLYRSLAIATLDSYLAIVLDLLEEPPNLDRSIAIELSIEFLASSRHTPRTSCSWTRAPRRAPRHKTCTNASSAPSPCQSSPTWCHTPRTSCPWTRAPRRAPRSTHALDRFEILDRFNNWLGMRIPVCFMTQARGMLCSLYM